MRAALLSQASCHRCHSAHADNRSLPKVALRHVGYVSPSAGTTTARDRNKRHLVPMSASLWCTGLDKARACAERARSIAIDDLLLKLACVALRTWWALDQLRWAAGQTAWETGHIGVPAGGWDMAMAAIALYDVPIHGLSASLGYWGLLLTCHRRCACKDARPGPGRPFPACNRLPAIPRSIAVKLSSGAWNDPPQ